MAKPTYLKKAQAAIANCVDATDLLGNVEVQHGHWFEESDDGRSICQKTASHWEKTSEPYEGFGWRARMKNNVHGGSYGWSFPVVSSEAMAIIAVLASEAALMSAERED